MMSHQGKDVALLIQRENPVGDLQFPNAILSLITKSMDVTILHREMDPIPLPGQHQEVLRPTKHIDLA